MKVSNMFYSMLVILTLLYSTHVLSSELSPDPNSPLIVLSLKELLNAKITIASSFDENELTSSASVSVIEPEDWKKRGDRSATDALSHTTGSIVIQSVFGSSLFQVRAYSNSLSARGSATLIDGVSVNTLHFSTSAYTTNNIQLGITDRIEVIRGPGSALYGSDAFHSVVSYNSFKAKKDITQLSLEGGQDGFYQSNIKLSKVLPNKLYVNFAWGASGQDPQNIQHTFTEPLTNTKQRGHYNNEKQDISSVIKLFNSEDTNIHFELSALHNSEKHPSGIGLGAIQNKTSIVLGDEDHSGQNTKFNLVKNKLFTELLSDITLKLDTYYWFWNGDTQLNLTSNGSPPIRYRRSDLAERKWGIHATIQQQISEWNTQWTVQLGTSDHKQTKSNSALFDVSNDVQFTPTTNNLNDKLGQQTIHDLSLEGKTKFFDKRFIATYGFRLDKYPDFGNQITPRVSSIYKLDKQSSLKLIYAEAFRAPTLREKIGSSTSLGDPNLDPEELKSLELVYMKHSDQWKSEIVFYKNKITNGIAVLPKTPTATQPEESFYTNFSKNKAEGIETKFYYYGTRWTSGFNLTYASSKSVTLDQHYTAYPKLALNADIAFTTTNNINLNLNLNAYDGLYLGDKTAATNPALVEKAKVYFRADLHIEKTFSPIVNAWINFKNVFDRKNTLPSVWNAEGGIQDIGFTASIGIEAKL